MRNFIRLTLTFGGLLALTSVGLSQPLPPPNPLPGGVEIQGRGPVHEAFAQPYVGNPQPGPVVPQTPPPPIPEEPAAQQPEGANVQWVGGYWAWDADSNQFLWVSGGY